MLETMRMKIEGQTTKNKIIILAVLVIVIIAIIAGGAWLFSKSDEAGQQEVSMDTPTNIVLDFYENWLNARRTTSTDPYAEGLDDSQILSKELRERLSRSEDQLEDGVDPVLCQVAIPMTIASMSLYELEDKSEILVLARDGLDGQAIFTLNRHNNGWYIDNIRCSAGEFAPPKGEFDFEREGFLLKDSVPPPLDPQYWHLVFEDNGEQGHTVPLVFNEGSICTLQNGDEEMCNPDQFSEATKATVYGDSSEYGVEVKKLEFTE